MCAEECWLCLSASRLYASIHVEREAFLFFVLVLGVRKDFQIALFNLGEKVDEGEQRALQSAKHLSKNLDVYALHNIL